jgi:hypothetical protein
MIVLSVLILGAEGDVWKGLVCIPGWMASLVVVLAAVVLVTGASRRSAFCAFGGRLGGQCASWRFADLAGLRQRRRMTRPPSGRRGRQAGCCLRRKQIGWTHVTRFATSQGIWT